MSTATTTTTIVGNLTRDPEIRYTREGQATTSLGRGGQPPVAEPGDQRVGGVDVVLRRRRPGGTWPRTSPSA